MYPSASWLNVFYAFVFGLPIYLCNTAAHLLGGGKTPVDLGKTLKDGRRLFGDNKTWKGIIWGIVVGTLTGVILWYLMDEKKGIFVNFPWYIGFFMSLGDHTADLMGAFIKRRLDIKPGGPLILYDQGSWMVIGLLFAWPFILPTPWFFFIILITLTPLVHFISNILGYWLKLKKVWY